MGVVADREGDEVRRRRLVELPRRGRALRVARELGELAVGDPGPRRGRVDGDVVERLVGRLVVDGVPGVGAVGLLHRPHLARVGDREAGRGEVAARGRGRGGLGRADVVEAELVALVLLDRRPEHEVLAAPGEGDRLAVEGRPRRREGPAPRSSWKRRAVRAARKVMTAAPVSVLGVGLPGQVEVVVQGVDARVADSGVDAVLDAASTRRGRGRARPGRSPPVRRRGRPIPRRRAPRRRAPRCPTTPGGGGSCRSSGPAPSPEHAARTARDRAAASTPRTRWCVTAHRAAAAGRACGRGGSAP